VVSHEAEPPGEERLRELARAARHVKPLEEQDLVAGREALVNNAELAAEMTRAGAQALGLKLFAAAAPAADPANSVRRLTLRDMRLRDRL